MIPLSELIWGLLEISFLIIVFVIGFLVTYLILPALIKFMKKKRYIGIDIHKNAQPEIAESGGLSIIIGITVSSIFLIILN